jgi:protein O-GlcNAc transferase
LGRTWELDDVGRGEDLGAAVKIVIWTGPAWEEWGPDSLLTGIGGSEAAATYLSAELAILGHDVEVVGQVRPGTYDSSSVGPNAIRLLASRGSVRFVDFREFTEYGGLGSRTGELVRNGRKVECDVFVSSRYLHALDTVRPDCRLKVLWMHDVHAGQDHHRRMGGYDAVFCLSRWALDLAQRFYPHMPPKKFVQTRNGIPTDLYRAAPAKEGWKVVYSSSLDRGLDRLLDFWPSVRAFRPDAELHVYYGFDTWERMALHDCDEVAMAQIQVFRTRLANMAEQGVVLHGRVGQLELAQAWLGARAWLYPTNFSETSCITAMEAQAAGAHCVCSRLAALPETARFAHLVDPPNTREGYREEFLLRVEQISRSEEQISRREGGKAEADELFDNVDRGREWTLRELGWDGVARQWDEFFKSRLES